MHNNFNPNSKKQKKFQQHNNLEKITNIIKFIKYLFELHYPVLGGRFPKYFINNLRVFVILHVLSFYIILNYLVFLLVIRWLIWLLDPSIEKHFDALELSNLPEFKTFGAQFLLDAFTGWVGWLFTLIASVAFFFLLDSLRRFILQLYDNIIQYSIKYSKLLDLDKLLNKPFCFLPCSYLLHVGCPSFLQFTAFEVYLLPLLYLSEVIFISFFAIKLSLLSILYFLFFPICFAVFICRLIFFFIFVCGVILALFCQIYSTFS